MYWGGTVIGFEDGCDGRLQTLTVKTGSQCENHKQQPTVGYHVLVNTVQDSEKTDLLQQSNTFTMCTIFYVNSAAGSRDNANKTCSRRVESKWVNNMTFSYDEHPNSTSSTDVSKCSEVTLSAITFVQKHWQPRCPSVPDVCLPSAWIPGFHFCLSGSVEVFLTLKWAGRHSHIKLVCFLAPPRTLVIWMWTIN